MEIAVKLTVIKYHEASIVKLRQRVRTKHGSFMPGGLCHKRKASLCGKEYLMKIHVIWGKWELENDTAMAQPWVLIFVAVSWLSQRDLYGAATLSLNPSIYLVDISEVRNYT